MVLNHNDGEKEVIDTQIAKSRNRPEGPQNEHFKSGGHGRPLLLQRGRGGAVAVSPSHSLRRPRRPQRPHRRHGQGAIAGWWRMLRRARGGCVSAVRASLPSMCVCDWVCMSRALRAGSMSVSLSPVRALFMFVLGGMPGPAATVFPSLCEPKITVHCAVRRGPPSSHPRSFVALIPLLLSISHTHTRAVLRQVQ